MHVIDDIDTDNFVEFTGSTSGVFLPANVYYRSRKLLSRSIQPTSGSGGAIGIGIEGYPRLNQLGSKLTPVMVGATGRVRAAPTVPQVIIRSAKPNKTLRCIVSPIIVC